MTDRAFANGRAIICKSSGGTSTGAFPDVCLTPPAPPVGPLPVPYPNTGKASDITGGSKSVTIDGKEVLLRDSSCFSKTTGNEAATRSQGMNVVTHTIQGKVYFISWSMDVLVEGENVVRHMDFGTQNHNPQPGGTPGWPHFSAVAVAAETVCDELELELDQIEDDLPPSTKKGAYTADSAIFVRGDDNRSTMLWACSKTLSGGRYKDRYRPYVLGRGGRGSQTNSTSDIPEHKYKVNKAAPYCSHAEARILDTLFRDLKPMPADSKLYISIRWRNSKGTHSEACEQCSAAIEKAREAGLTVELCP